MTEKTIKHYHKWIFIVMCMMGLFNLSPTNAQTLVLHHRNGKTTDVELESFPQVKFQNDKILISSWILEMEFDKKDILSFTYKGNTTSINDLEVKNKVSQENDLLVFHDIESTDKIAVYTLNGILLPVSILRNGSSATLSLSAIPTGIYLLSVNGHTTKFTKR